MGIAMLNPSYIFNEKSSATPQPIRQVIQSMSTNNQLNPYKGKLNISAIACGMNAAIKNANRLANDARLLFEHERWPTAASIAILSIEESGKVPILRRFVGATEQELKGLWKEYRCHTSKNVAWILPDLVEKGARSLESLSSICDQASDHPNVLDAIKQIGFYSDCLGSTNWSMPSDIADKLLAEHLVTTSELLANKRHITERELELWETLVVPVINGPNEAAHQGLIAWHETLIREGLAEPGKITMQAFIKGTQDEEKAKE
ncbi:AbiV family abortive infection protein [Pseudomonas sp. 1928-m]|uniref:AbiV family abortive infection protein n=1 Tax=Pseudomonas sp. 1928-m TaxID=3033804 RepID=UPI0023E011A8|nr:AbiV family abortive infection protein [Pseudomonas sp. 1928-m]MDF3195126.1 AbiV family abortive infection protein [Pseudomonas sp. 1928-m]